MTKYYKDGTENQSVMYTGGKENAFHTVYNMAKYSECTALHRWSFGHICPNVHNSNKKTVMYSQPVRMRSSIAIWFETEKNQSRVIKMKYGNGSICLQIVNKFTTQFKLRYWYFQIFFILGTRHCKTLYHQIYFRQFIYDYLHISLVLDTNI